jgi:S-adenosylmethionine/arginine decarboxylase-like enzyme
MGRNPLSLYEICQDCDTRCCKEPGPPAVFPEEIEKIRAYIKEKKLTDHIIESKGFYIIPREKDNCAYLKEGGCEIQEVKPLECLLYPLSIDENLQVGISTKCPAKHLLTNNFISEGKKILDELTPQQKRAIVKSNIFGDYRYTKEPSNFGMELILDLYGCKPEILKSKEKLKDYFRIIVPMIEMKAVGEPKIPPKFGKGTLYGYSAVQFIQTSSVGIHLAEKMLEAHVNIFSCKKFDPKKTEKFTKRFFKARKTKVKVEER